VTGSAPRPANQTARSLPSEIDKVARHLVTQVPT